MKKLIISITSLYLSLISCCLQAQEQDATDIRNFNHSLVFSDQKGDIEQAQFSDYGEWRSRVNSNARFLYQGQEYESFLGLYFFQSRLYDPLQKRFMQPDPYSQYFSVYLFVGSDPINYIDLDGQFGKPLVLYEEEHWGGSQLLSGSTEDFLAETYDSYQYSMSDFINGKIGKLPDWNGNVYIKAHMGREMPEIVELERIHDNTAVRSKGKEVKFHDYGEDEYSIAYMDSEEFGNQLRYFAEYQGIPIENIVGAGCEGGETTYRIGQGYAKRPASESDFDLPPSGKLEVSTYGFKEGNMAFCYGETCSFGDAEDAVPLARSRMSLLPKGTNFKPNVVQEGSGQSRVAGYSIDYGQGITESMDYIEGEDLQDFADARIPKLFNPAIEDYHIPY